MNTARAIGERLKEIEDEEAQNCCELEQASKKNPTTIKQKATKRKWMAWHQQG